MDNDTTCAPANLSVSLPKDENSEDSTISEHLSSAENDRSLEFEVMSPSNFSMVVQNLPEERISLETLPQSLDTSFVSLNGLERIINDINEGECPNNDQFHSGTESTEDSLNIFAHVDLNDKMLGDKHPNDSINYRDGLSNASLSLGTSTTEYRQFQDDLQNKFAEFHNAISYKDEQIEKLTQSLQQSVLTREEMKQHFKNEINLLKDELKKNSDLLEHRTNYDDFQSNLSKLESLIKPEQIEIFEAVKASLANLIKSKVEEVENELNVRKVKLDSDKCNFESEIAALRDKIKTQEELRMELESKHSEEMEELRTYFEKKCADLEKNFSDDILSRKLSGASSLSETELPSSDFVGHARPGPGGDASCTLDYTRHDVMQLARDLNSLHEKISVKKLEDLQEQDLAELRREIDKFLHDIRADLQNKYHAELEILREDFDNRLDELQLGHEKKLHEVEAKYGEVVEDLNAQLRGRIVSTAQQEVASSGDFEFDEVVQSYERRLQEQVAMAELDIVTRLANQIERLAASDDLDDEWPPELLRLKSLFSLRHRSDLDRLEAEHQADLSRLKAEHDRALERARRRSLRDVDSLNKGELELLRERDDMKCQIVTLRNLIGELFKYFTRCEDELNSTLVDELTRKSEDVDGSTRVRLAPNLQVLTSIDDTSDLNTIDLKGELGACLDNLRADANAILQLTSHLSNDDSATPKQRPNQNLNSDSDVTRKLIDETRMKNELNEELAEARSVIQTLENDRVSMETSVEQLLERQKMLEGDLAHARSKIAELIENGHREIVSEGYGEGQLCSGGMSEAVAGFRAVQERARVAVESPGELQGSDWLDLVERLTRIGEKMVEEARKEKDDFRQQIEAADKKYRTTCRFLEEQATEREQERDEAQKRIDAMCQQLKEKDKERAQWEQRSNELEQLETQLREQSKLTETLEQRCQATERERQEAVDKIYELRDIIRHLEEQLRIGVDGEQELRNAIAELEALVKNRPQSEEVVARSEEIVRLRDYIGELEAEVQKLRVDAEFAGEEGTLEQIRAHLSDFETTLDKQTKDLECLHAISTTCSSPSEDMSIRDVLHQNLSSAIYDECEVPLQQLARLREKLLRHSRAEDAALKRIRDLEMHISSLRTDLEESQNDRDLLKRQISDHLVLISNLQIRLDEQRIRAEHMEKQTNTSLEVQNYDLKNTIIALEEKIVQRDKTIAQLKTNMEETRKMLELREKQLSAPTDAELIGHMQSQIEHLRAENAKLKARFPDDSLEIERLRERLSQTERKLDAYLNLSLDANQIDELNSLKMAGVSIQDLLDMEMRRHSQHDTPISPIFKRHSQPELSKLECADSATFHSLQIPVMKAANSTEKHVRFEDDLGQEELVKKNELIADYEARLTRLDDVEAKLTELTRMLAETETNLKRTTVDFENERKREKDALVELGAMKSQLQDRDNDVKQLKNELNDVTSQLDLANRQLGGLTRIIAEKEEQIKNTTEVIRQEKEANSKLTREVADLRNNGQCKSDEINNLKVLKDELNRELAHYQSLLAEKEKIIEQMSVDSKSLHVNLETIQSKIQETGNIIDLSRKLREEQRKNARLTDELHVLQTQLSNYNDKKSLETIADRVQRQLDYSVQLDESLLSAVGGGEPDLQTLTTNLKRQKSLNKQLVRAKEAAEKKYQDLVEQSERDKRIFGEEQMRNVRLIEELRIQLDRTLDGAEELRSELLQLNAAKMALERQIHAGMVKKAFDNQNDNKQVQMKQLTSTTMDGLVQEQIELLEKQVEQLTVENGELRARKDEIELALTRHVTQTAQGDVELKKQLTSAVADREAVTKKYEQARSFLDEIDADRKSLRDQLSSLQNQLKEHSTSPIIPDVLHDKIRDLRSAVQDNVAIMELVTRLTHEKRLLQDHIEALENRSGMPFDDPNSRANYLFAKYLRVDSYRKALCYQKNYLLTLVGRMALPPPPPANWQRRRFRVVAMVVVSTLRMRALVRRWHSGKRLVLRHDGQRARFQVGQPVSSVHFNAAAMATTATASVKAGSAATKEDMPWFGSSPPSKDSHRRISDGVPLASPSLLNKYVERFTLIQERLGLDSAQ